jgi:hypothetical protein
MCMLSQNYFGRQFIVKLQSLAEKVTKRQNAYGLQDYIKI